MVVSVPRPLVGPGVSVRQATPTGTATSTLTPTVTSIGQPTTTIPSPSPVPTTGSTGGSLKDTWSDYDLVYPKGHSAALSLLAQNQMVQDVVQEAFQLIEKHLFTVNGLPNTLECAAMSRNALVNGANAFSFHPMAQRIASDSKYRRDLSSLVNSHIYICTEE